MLAGIAGCWTGPVAEPVPEPVQRPAGDVFDVDLEIVLVRTPCFGMCPVYELHIYPDGRVHWYGRDNVAERGERTKRLARPRMQQLKRAVDHAQFFSLSGDAHEPAQPSCTRTPGGGMSCSFTTFSVCTDTSHSIITVRTRAREKRVDDAHCDDDSAIGELEHQLESIAASWIGR